MLRVRTAQVALPLQEVTADEVARAVPLVADAKAGKQVEFFALVTAYKTLLLDQLRNRPPLSRSATRSVGDCPAPGPASATACRSTCR